VTPTIRKPSFLAADLMILYYQLNHAIVGEA